MNNKYPYIMAELGCNHNGDLDLAEKMIDQAKLCGCDAIKLQLWKRDELITNQHLHELNNGKVKLENVQEWKTKELGLSDIFEQTEKFSIYKEEHIELFEYSRKVGIDYSSTAINKEGIDFLIDQKVAFLKISSMDVNNLDLIEYSISKNYPIYISLGMASLGEIESIVKVIPERFRENVTLLHCVSIYPPRDDIINLNFIKTLKGLFGIKVGYSDHTMGTLAPIIAIALGATAIEKHFTLDKNMPGWDHRVSADFEEMKFVCDESKRIVNILGNGKKELSKEEMEKRLKLRRSLVTKNLLKKETILSSDDFLLKRPGTGIQPNELKYLVGRKLNKDIKEDQTLFWEDFV